MYKTNHHNHENHLLINLHNQSDVHTHSSREKHTVFQGITNQNLNFPSINNVSNCMNAIPNEIKSSKLFQSYKS